MKNLEYVTLSGTLSHSPYACAIDAHFCEPRPEFGDASAPLWTLQVDDQCCNESLVLLNPLLAGGGKQVSGQYTPIVLDQRRELYWLALGSLALQQDKEEEAITLWQHVPDIAHYLFGLAQTFETPAQAIRLYKLSSMVHPSVSGYYQLGNKLAEVGELDNALSAYEKGLDLADSGHPDTLKPLLRVRMGNIYRNQGNAEMARDSYEQALVLHEDLEEAIIGLARLDIAASRSEAVVTRLIESLDRTPESKRLRYWLAQAYLDLGQLDEARQVLEVVVQQHDDYIHAWRLLGYAARQQGDLLGALEAYERSLVLEPYDTRTQSIVTELEDLLNR